MLAQSIGGGGGSAIYALGIVTGQASMVGETLGGSEGGTDNGGTLTLITGGNVSTTGSFAPGVVGQTIGGGGGFGAAVAPSGMSVGSGGVQFALGSTGGSGGAGDPALRIVVDDQCRRDQHYRRRVRRHRGARHRRRRRPSRFCQHRLAGAAARDRHPRRNGQPGRQWNSGDTHQRQLGLDDWRRRYRADRSIDRRRRRHRASLWRIGPRHRDARRERRRCRQRRQRVADLERDDQHQRHRRPCAGRAIDRWRRRSVPRLRCRGQYLGGERSGQHRWWRRQWRQCDGRK